MEILHASIALLASMVLILAGMVGWLYWQQTRMFQNLNSVVMILADMQASTSTASMEDVKTEDLRMADSLLNMKEVVEEDDRVSVEREEETTIPTAEEEVEEAVETVTGPPIDTDGLESKTKKELQDILTKKGIPYGKNDSKNVLISLIKATA